MTKTKPFIPKLKDLCKHIGFDVGFDRAEITLAASNVDDVFRALRKGKIKEVKVNFDEMWMVAGFILANIPSFTKQKSEFYSALNIMREGKVDKFMGVKLILEE